MRRIFLDVGAFIGTSVQFFRDNYHEAYQFEIYCFEPRPVNLKHLRKVKNITIIPKVAWSSDGEIPLFIGSPKGSSVFADKRTGGITGHSILVPAVDLARYVRENFRQEDEIWLKLNIEGAEYEVIPRLHEAGLIPWFDRMYICWHGNKIPSLASKHKQVAAMVPNAMFDWRSKEILPL